MTPEIWVLLIGAVIGTGGIAAGIQTLTGRGKLKAQEQNIAADTALMVVEMVREEIRIKDDELEEVRAEMSALKSAFKELKAQLRHWRKVAEAGRNDYREQHGEDPEWHLPFEELE